MALFITGYKERQQLSHVAVSAPNSLPIWCYLDMVVHEQAQLIGGLALKSRGQGKRGTHACTHFGLFSGPSGLPHIPRLAVDIRPRLCPTSQEFFHRPCLSSCLLPGSGTATETKAPLLLLPSEATTWTPLVLHHLDIIFLL